jgi:hypothetical protein
MQSICKPNCKPVYNLQQNGVSRKMLISQMIRSGKSINYSNSETATIYKTILSLDYDANKKLLLLLKYKLYMKYVGQVISCGKYNSQQIYEMIDFILANLTPEEYKIVYEIVDPITDPDALDTLPIKKTFYVVVDINQSIFIIKNYTGEFMIPNNAYEFDLEHPSNLNTKFCLSQERTAIPVGGLVYNGTPGTPGANVIFTVPDLITYELYIFNSLSFAPFSWGYVQPFLPVLQANKSYSSFSFLPLSLQQQSSLSIYYNQTLKFCIQNTIIPFITSSNYNYLLYYGTYYLQVPKLYTLALLNKGQETSISYVGKIITSTTSEVFGTTNDGIYNFYYDTIVISVYESFTPISFYSLFYGYLSGQDSFLFDSSAASDAQPAIRTDHLFDTNGIEALYSQSRLYIDYTNNVMKLNTDVNYNTTSNATIYGMYNGTYIFYTSTYITFLNKGKENIFVINGTNSISGPGPDGINNYLFYKGVIQVRVLGNFNKMSLYTFNKGYCGGLYLLTYDSIFDANIPHSYSFNNIINTTLSDPSPVVYNTVYELNSTTIDFTGTNGTSFDISSSSYNIIQKDSNGRIVFTNMTNLITTNLSDVYLQSKRIAYSSTTQYTMTKGTYVFFNISGLYITFMTKNKPVFSSGTNVGSFFTSGTSPNGDRYTFNISDKSLLALLKPIIVTVTDNFGYLSICTPTGYNGGQNLITYV